MDTRGDREVFVGKYVQRSPDNEEWGLSPKSNRHRSLRKGWKTTRQETALFVYFKLYCEQMKYFHVRGMSLGINMLDTI